MATLRLKHNPSHMPDDELIRSFVVRQRDLAAILETVRENTGPSNQHLLILGPRGMGKTTLVNRAVAEIRRVPELSRLWYPILFDEESYTVTSAGELWFQALAHLADQTQDKELEQARRSLQPIVDRDRLRDASLARLLEFADTQQKRLLLVFENVDMIFDDQLTEDDAWDVRHTLQNEPRIAILATSTTRLDSFHDSKKPLYELFREHPIERLALEECRTVWRLVTGSELPPNQARPIQIFTGGNTRLLTILATFAKDRSFRELMDDLVGLIDENTPYFKHNVEALPKESRKIFVTLAELWSPATARQVADRTRGDIRAVSAQLGRLQQQGIIEVAKRVDKTMMYQVAERMYNLYHLLRRRGSGRVQAVVEFIVRYYDQDGMQRLLASMATEACDLDGDRREDHVRAYVELLRRLPDQHQRDKILGYAPARFLELPDIVRFLQELTPSSDESPPPTESELRARLAESPDDSTSLRHLAYIFIARGDYDDALEILDHALTLDGSSPQTAALIILALHRHPALAPEAHANSLRRLAVRTTGLAEEAVCSQLALRLALAGARDEARECANEVLARWPGQPMMAFAAGCTFSILGDITPAKDAFIHATDLDPFNMDAVLQLSTLLVKDRAFEEAEGRLRGCLALRSREPKLWLALLDLLGTTDAAPQTVLAALKRATKFNPHNVDLAHRLGKALANLSQWAEAEEVFRRVVTDMHADQALLGFFVCLLRQDKIEEARSFAQVRVTMSPSREAHFVASIIFGIDKNIDRQRYHLHEAAKCPSSDLPTTMFLIEDLLKFGDVMEARRAAIQFIEIEQNRPKSLFLINEIILGSALEMLYPDVVEWARELAVTEVFFGRGSMHLAMALGRMNLWAQAWSPLEVVLSYEPFVPEILGDIVGLLSLAAAHGHASKAYEVLKASPSALRLEPIAVALARVLGEPTNPPQEVSEVADDIVRDIERLRKALADPPAASRAKQPSPEHLAHRRARKKTRAQSPSELRSL